MTKLDDVSPPEAFKSTLELVAKANRTLDQAHAQIERVRAKYALRHCKRDDLSARLNELRRMH